MPDGLRLALTTLTVVPSPQPRQVDRRSAGHAMLWAPVVGAGLGAVAAAVALAVRHVVPAGSWVPAVAAVATLALLTRALHLDGLADTADGLGSRRPPAEALQVMKRGDIGPFGVVTLVVTLLVQVAAVDTAMALHRGSVALVLAAAAGRLAVTLACTRGVPSARPEGLGALVAQTVRPLAALLSALLVLAAAVALGAGDDDIGAWHAAAAVLIATVAALGLLRHAVRRLGGITGDVLGALVEVATAVALLGFALSR